MKRAIFLDRDNTIIHNDGDLGNPEQVRLIRGAAHAIGSLRQLGYRIIVVSNQGGVARGKYSERDVDAVHERIAQMVYDSAGAIIDRFYYCPFHPEGTVPEYAKEHPWRKPQPGMLLEAARSLDLDLRECWAVGDGERDIEAGRAAGCQTILLTRKTSVNTKADFQAESLAEAAAIIAQNRVRTRQVIPPAPTVVVSPRSEHELQPTAAGAPAQPRMRLAGHEDDEAGAPISGVGQLEAIETQDEDEVESEAVVTETVEALHEPEPSGSEVEEATTEQPNAPRRDPFRHIPIRIRGIERTRRDDPSANADRLLTELLAEIRSWRHSQREFTPAMMLGSIASLLMLIVAILLGVYLEPALATPWIGVTIVGQLGIAVFIILNLKR